MIASPAGSRFFPPDYGGQLRHLVFSNGPRQFSHVMGTNMYFLGCGSQVLLGFSHPGSFLSPPQNQTDMKGPMRCPMALFIIMELQM